MRFIKTIVSFALAILVLASSTSFTVGLHVCRGHVHNIAVMQKAQPCAMELMAADLGFADEDCGMSSLMKCCEDRTLSFEGTDYHYKAATTLTLEDLTTVPAVLPHVLSVVTTSQLVSTLPFFSYKPPLIDRDVIILVQSFLI